MEREIGYSILVCTYNQTDYIEECLDSIKNQTFFLNNKNYEVLVGIDGCHPTLEKINEIKNKYEHFNFRFYFMSQNNGLFITKNTLLLKSIYDKIVCFDSDDIMKPSMIQEIDSNWKNFELMKFYCINFLNNDINHIQRIYSPDGVNCISWSVYEKLGGYKPWKTSSDTDFLIRMRSISCKEFLLESPLFYRRIHGNSLTQHPTTGHGSPERIGYYQKLFKQGDDIYVTPVVNEEFELI